MATKNFAAKVTIGGALQSSFSSAFGSADRQIKKLGQSIKDMAKTRAVIKGFRESTASVEKLGSELAKAKTKLEAARAALAGAKTPTAALTREVDKAERHVSSLNAKIDAENTKLGQLKSKLDQARISTNNLATADAKLEARMKKTALAIRNHGVAKEKMGTARGRMMGWAGAGLAVGGAIASMRPAMRASNEFNDSLVDVGKYVDGADTPEALAEIGASIREIGRNSPLGAKGITDLVIGAGKLGMAKKDALEFAKAMDVMSAGLDLTSEEAATLLTKIKSGMRLSIPEVLNLGDAMNYLGDVTAADSKNIVDIVQRQGSVIKATTKLTAEEIAALAASFDIAAPGPEAAATAMKNFTKALTVGQAASKGNEWAYKMLKLDPKSVAAGMQKDAKATINLVLERLGKVAEEDKGAVLSKLFGEESKGIIANVVTSYEDLKKSFENVGKASNYLGRSEQERARNMEKYSVQQKLFNAQMFDLGVSIGDALKEGITPLFKVINPLLERFAKWRKENPRLFSTIVQTTAAVVGIAAAVIGLGLAISTVMFAWSGLAAGFAALGLVSGPVLAVFAGIAAAATAAVLTIRKYWEPISAWFKGVWAGIVEGWESSGGPAMWTEIKSAVGSVAQKFMELIKPVDMTDEEFKKVFESGKAFGNFLGTTLAGFVGGTIAFLKDLANSFTMMANDAVSAFNYIKNAVSPFFEWMGAKIKWLGEALGSLSKSVGVSEMFKPTNTNNPSKNTFGTGMAPSGPYYAPTSYQAPAMRKGGSGGPININVNGAPGQSEEAIAQNVVRKLQDIQASQGRSNYYDEAIPA